MPFYIGHSASPLLATLFTLVYWGIAILIAINVIHYYWVKKMHKPHTLNYKDFQHVIDDDYEHIMMPIWADSILAGFNTTAASYYKALEQVITKNREYLTILKDLDASSSDYDILVECEYSIITMISDLAASFCAKFMQEFNKPPIGYAECPHSVVQKYCALVKLFFEQKTRIENEEFIPPSLKEQYLQIYSSIFSLFDFINSSIQVY